MMIFNTFVLKITKFMILAEISQNMADDNRNVIENTHNIGAEERFYRFHENQHFSVDFRRFRK